MLNLNKTPTQTQLKILELLSSHQILSGEKIAKVLNISRTAVWKNIQNLKKLGYPIVSEKKGYSLKSKDLIFYTKLEKFLKELDPKFKIFYLWETTSTMDVAKELSEKEELCLIIAEKQTLGRGRFNRHWISNEGGVWMSLLIKPFLSLRDSFILPYVAGVSVVEALIKITNFELFLKWPNDIVYKEDDVLKKVAGILVELGAEVDKLKYAIIGIGINVNNEISSLEPTAISLKEISNSVWDRTQLILEIVRIFMQYLKKSFKEILDTWEKRSLTLGQMVRIIQLDKEIVGEAFALSEDGGLLIKTKQGEIVKVFSGDCFHLRFSS